MEGFWRQNPSTGQIPKVSSGGVLAVQGLRHMRDTLHPDELRDFDLHSNMDSDVVNANGQIMKFNSWYDSSR